jgi:hypothetical protein
VYLLIVAMIDSPRDLRIFGWFFLAIMVVAFVYQFAEYVHGGRLVFFGSMPTGNYFGMTKYIQVGDVMVPYLWNRAMVPTIVGVFMALGAVVGKRRFAVNAFLAGAGLLGIVLTQIRAIYFGVAVGILALLGLPGWGTKSAGRLVLLVVALGAVFIALTSVLAASMGDDPAAVIAARASSLLEYNTQDNWAKRASDAHLAWTALRQSPLIGFGWGSGFASYVGESGMNLLLARGFLGAAMILVMFVTVLVKALRLAWRLKPSLEQSWLFGLSGAMLAFLAMSVTQDVLSAGGVAVIVAVFVDRIQRFADDGLVQVRIRPDAGVRGNTLGHRMP